MITRNIGRLVIASFGGVLLSFIVLFIVASVAYLTGFNLDNPVVIDRLMLVSFWLLGTHSVVGWLYSCNDIKDI